MSPTKCVTWHTICPVYSKLTNIVVNTFKMYNVTLIISGKCEDNIGI